MYPTFKRAKFNNPTAKCSSGECSQKDAVMNLSGEDSPEEDHFDEFELLLRKLLEVCVKLNGSIEQTSGLLSNVALLADSINSSFT